jgi:hypothetical protein
MARTRRNQKAGGFLDWLLGKKNETTTAPVISTGATAPILSPVPAEATAIKVDTTASPISTAVGGSRKRKSYRKHRKANRKARKQNGGKSRKAQRKSRKSRKSRRNY